MARLKAAWADDYERWTRRDLSAKRSVYFWADGVYFNPRLDHDKQCLLVTIGADDVGNKDIVGLSDGYRASEQSWLELLLELKRRGLEAAPELAVGDGALVRTGPRTDGGLGPHFGRRYARPTDKPVSNDAGSTRPTKC